MLNLLQRMHASNAKLRNGGSEVKVPAGVQEVALAGLQNYIWAGRQRQWQRQRQCMYVT